MAQKELYFCLRVRLRLSVPLSNDIKAFFKSSQVLEDQVYGGLLAVSIRIFLDVFKNNLICLMKLTSSIPKVSDPFIRNKTEKFTKLRKCEGSVLKFNLKNCTYLNIFQSFEQIYLKG